MRKLALALVGVLASATLSLTTSQPASAQASSSALGATGVVALTFDDGPHPVLTPMVLDILKKHNVKATFFLVGEQVQKYPHLAKRIVAEGHTIGNHSWDHTDFTTITAYEAASAQITTTNEIIEQTVGFKPVLFRYPYGKETELGNQAIRAHSMWGGVLWHWTAPGPGDFECPGWKKVQDYVLNNLTNQALILLHDGGDTVDCGRQQLKYLERAIPAAQARGYSFGVVAPADGPSSVNQQSWVKVVAP